MRSVLLFALIFLIASPAYAHRPYLIKEGTISDPNGNSLILEKLYGDGIFTSDPVSFQIRSKSSALLAYTPTSEHIAVFCPDVRFCWAFLYGIVSPFATGMKLNHESIDWNSKAQNLDLKGDEAGLYQKYLEDEKQKRAYSYSFDYPEMRKDKQGKGFSASAWSIVFSPLFIIANHIIPLAFVTVLSIVPFILHWLFFKRFSLHKKLHRILLKTSGGIIILGYALFYCLALFVLGFTIGTPLLYMFAAMLLGIASPKLIRLKKKLVPEGS
ncbi:MAG: hypothetical protein HYS17_08040 [Micavibrio aeruginosavorus]|uniref:DUF4105 domain-containing protein n=1 Tax=Micavibrio aeruginosavorus TaxID=349221 RepID=A0A7T5R0V7_9BACT|nr:MAG: hypothetical protein HYS17_08040 [Micavibrio aeruginosavorus]